MTEPLDRLKAALGDRYALERELGAGGMAMVYLARDLKHHRNVAVKVLRPDLAASLGVERFNREITIAAGLTHPHILPLHDSGKADGFLFYVMPLVEGESLRQKLDREGQLPVAEAVRIADCVADALSYAHSRGIIHRDIKPANILFQEDVPLVADFGIALAVTAVGQGRLTESGISLGTPHYMSPEQAAGEAELTAATDVYSLGAVLYEMLTGEPPHTGATVQSIVARLLMVEPTRPRVIRSSVPPALDSAVMKALAKLPLDRFSGAEQFGRSLKDITRTPFQADSEPSTPSNQVRLKTFQLTAQVCRQIHRQELDPRMIGDHLHYLDNDVPSEVLVIYLHGFGGDHRTFQEILKRSPYRGVAVTLYGFEPKASRRTVLSLGSHSVILRASLTHMVETLAPEITILLGFSSGADMGFHLLSDWPQGSPLVVDGYLGMGCNLNLSTCFVSRVLAAQTSEAATEILPHLRDSGAGATTLGEWLNIHEYLVRILRKFQSDLRPLRKQGQDIIEPFLDGGDPFPGWFRATAERVNVVRCVFADTEMESRPVQSLLLANLDSGLLGNDYREDSIQIEPGADHFDLLSPERVNRHLAELLQEVRKER